MHIDNLTQGTEIKGNENQKWRVISSITEEKKIFVELALIEEPKVEEKEEELLEEEPNND